MENYDYIGYAGSFFVSINLIPQIYHIYIIKDASSISIVSYVLNIIASILLVAYGYLINKIPVIISNGMVFLFSIIMLLLKYIYKNNDITYKIEYKEPIEINDINI
jgi:uncharacterized protein with PQ loop repeat